MSVVVFGFMDLEKIVGSISFFDRDLTGYGASLRAYPLEPKLREPGSDCLAAVYVIRTASDYEIAAAAADGKPDLRTVAALVDHDLAGSPDLGSSFYQVVTIQADAIAKDLASIILDVLQTGNHTPDNELLGFAGLSDRIDLAAGAISDLRINSAADVVDELRTIASALRQMERPAVASPSELDEIRGEMKRVLHVLASIFDALENSRLASLIVSGAISSLVGGVGWPAAFCNMICLASWHGKDALIAAIEVMPGLGGRKSRQGTAPDTPRKAVRKKRQS